MKVKGEHTISAPRQKVWDALLDPQVLAATLPGCEALEPIGENQYRMKMKLAISSVQGAFDATIALKDVRELQSYRLELDGKGKIGFVNGGGDIVLKPSAESSTLIEYEGDVKVGGLIAGVGQRLMDMTSKMMIKRFFSSLSERLENRQT